jgi:hypothetical protein
MRSTKLWTSRWDIKKDSSWRHSVSQFIHRLEESGCVIEGKGVLKVPSFDASLIMALQKSFSPFSEEWNQSLQSILWNHAELQCDEQARSVGFRWLYWSPSQLMFHVLMAVLFFATGGALPALLLQFVPFALALHDQSRLRDVFTSLGLLEEEEP